MTSDAYQCVFDDSSLTNSNAEVAEVIDEPEVIQWCVNDDLEDFLTHNDLEQRLDRMRSDARSASSKWLEMPSQGLHEQQEPVWSPHHAEPQRQALAASAVPSNSCLKFAGFPNKEEGCEDQRSSEMDFHEAKDTAKTKKTIWLGIPWPIDVGPGGFWSNPQDCQYRQLHELKTHDLIELCMIMGDERERGSHEWSSDRQFFGRIASVEDHRRKCNDSVA